MHIKLLVVLLVFLLNVTTVFLTAAEPDYREDVELMVDVYPGEMSCNAILRFSFNDLNRPLILNNFRSEPSFVSLFIDAHFFPGGGSTRVSIFLNSSKIDRRQGRFVADMIIYRLEQTFKIPTLSYNESVGILYSGELNFPYYASFPAIELRNIFLESLPFQGFRQVLTSSQLDSHNHSIYVSLAEEGGWRIQVWILGGTTGMILGREQTISLKEITGYLGSIDFSYATFSSTLRIRVTFNTFGGYELVINKVLPAHMPEMREVHGTLIQYDFFYDITGSSVEDLSISLTIFTSNIIAIGVVLFQIVIILCSIIIIKKRKR